MSHTYGVINLERKEHKEIQVQRVKKEGTIELIVAALAMIIFLPLGIVWFVLAITDNNKCKHWRECPWYKKGDHTCTKDQGMYYNFNSPGGCYLEVEKRKEELRKQGKILRKLR